MSPDPVQIAFSWGADEDQDCSPERCARHAAGEPVGVHRRGGDMPAYTLAQAIAATGRSRSALIRAIRSGKLSASRDASGTYLVDPSELTRVYGSGESADSPLGEDRHADLTARLAAEEARNAILQDVVADLRRRLDTATEQLGEALQQVRLLTDQRPAAPAPARRSWWRWRRG